MSESVAGLVLVIVAITECLPIASGGGRDLLTRTDTPRLVRP
jgi:hypothetical protein